MEQCYDVAIIGGGINGCGAAADAALRGLSVVLCEQGDLASQTSSKSTKLIHGGLRYLEQYDFGLVKKALHERQQLMALAPHLVHPLKLVLPHEKTMRPGWLIRVGLFIYDHLSRKNRLPKSQSININSHPDYFQPIHKKFKKGFTFYDGITNDARLTLVNALQAQQHGARILTYTKLVDAQYKVDRWHLTLKGQFDGTTTTLKAKTLINATGPWVESANTLLNTPQHYKMKLVKGSHIVVPALYEGHHAYFLQGDDKRIIFAIPYYGYTMLGTTEVEFKGDLEQNKISEEEINYLCQLSNMYFNQKTDPTQIINSWSGIRPLIQNKDDNLHEISRDYSIEFNTQSGPVVSVYGGKITTYRKLSAEAVDGLKPVFPSLKPSQTACHPLPGAELDGLNFNQYKISAYKRYDWLEHDLLERYLMTYGSRTEFITKNLSSKSELGLHFGQGLYQAEVDYLIHHEWACTSEDILWRRTKLGLNFSPENMETLEKYLNDVSHRK